MGDLATKVTTALGGAATTPKQLYRVRKTWSDSKSQKGAYTILANAKACADKNPGYSVFDADGNAVYTSGEGALGITGDTSFKVQISVPELAELRDLVFLFVCHSDLQSEGLSFSSH